MLNLLAHGGGVRFCDGVSRRQALQIGGLGTLGLTLPDLLRSRAAAAPVREHPLSGRAKRVILLFMWGGPAHQDTWDLKPEAPPGIRGEFMPIDTNVPGLQISEHFPLIARHADKLALIRSVGQEDNNHSTGAHASLTGRRHELKAESFGARDTDFPHIGSVLSQLRPARAGMPPFVSLPEIIATTNGAITPGQGGGFLGKQYDPFQISDHPDRAEFAIEPLRFPSDMTLNRVQGRRLLLEQVDRAAQLTERAAVVSAMDSFYGQALDLVAAPKARAAFDLAAESDAERMRYGWHTFGQSLLLARRLSEAGVQLVTVYWHREKKTVDSTWDTHALNFQEMKNRLMPSVDRPIAALLQDLQERGLLDETLVIWNSEFGRTPRINGMAGRDHWGPCNTVVMAGAGIPGGQVFGASDAQAAAPSRDKVTQDDIAATVYHLLGVHPETLIQDRTGRPFPVALGEPIYKLMGGETPVDSASKGTPRLEPIRFGPFTSMLRERGNRFLVWECGDPQSAAEWTLKGFSEPAGSGLDSHRTIAKTAGTFTYTGKFYPHFDYGWLVFRLAQPQPLAGVSLTLSGRLVPLPAELLESAPQQVWQIPLPEGRIGEMSSFELAVTAPDWAITALAVTGDRIRDMHLDLLNA